MANYRAATAAAAAAADRFHFSSANGRKTDEGGEGVVVGFIENSPFDQS